MRSRTLAFLGALALSATASPGLDFTPPGCSPSPFSDVPFDAPICRWVKKAAEDGIVPGCGGGKFCPDLPVNRLQAAAFVERAMRGTTTWTPGYYARTIVVSPVPGNPQASGAALLAAVAVSDVATIMNRYLIKLEPGIYDVSGSLGVQLPRYVDLEGSGMGVTTILAQSLLDSTLVGLAGDTALRFLTVRGEMSSLGNSDSVSAHGSGPQRISHVRVESLHGIAVSAQAGASLWIDHSRLETQAGTALRVANSDGTVEDSYLAVNRAIPGQALAMNVANGVLRLRRSEVFAGTVNGFNRAMEAYQSTVVLEGARLRAAGGPYPSAFVIVVNLLSSNATIVASDLQATGSTQARWTLHADSSAGAFVSRVRDSRFGNGAIQASANDDIFIAGSQLDEAQVNPNGGAITCFKSFDENFANPGGLSACP